MTQGERVKEIRKTIGLTLEKFGEKVGVGKTAISNIEKGNRNLTDQMAKSICREFNVNETWLRTGKGEMFQKPETFSLDALVKERGASDLELEILKAYFELDPKIRRETMEHFKNHLVPADQPREMRMINYFQRLASAGTGSYLFDNIPETIIEIPADAPDADFAVGVNGDSMEPEYIDGDKLLVKKCLELEVGDIGLFRIGTECYVKELGEGCLISHNKKYEPITAANIEIIGKVVGKIGGIDI